MAGSTALTVSDLARWATTVCFGALRRSPGAKAARKPDLGAIALADLTFTEAVFAETVTTEAVKQAARAAMIAF
jgi:hypothetical protein